MHILALILLARFLVGACVIAVGVFLFVRPQIVEWLGDQTNLRAAKWAAWWRWDEQREQGYLRSRRVLTFVAPIFVIIMGIAVMLGGFF